MSNRIFLFPSLNSSELNLQIEANNIEEAFQRFASEFPEPITEEHFIIEDNLGNIIDCQIKDSIIICKMTIKYSDNCLLSTEDIDPLTKEFSLENYKPVLDKLTITIEQQTFNHRIKVDNYKDLFFTSDIHSDYRKFLQLLVNGGFIKLPNNIGHLYEDDNIYNPRIISESEWIKNDCLIVIVGDLVDGRRVTPLYQLKKTNKDATEDIFKAEISDPIGCFELLLHMLIYNLRIKGKKCNSNILFTIGNHDAEVLLTHENYLQAFVHSGALQYYKGTDPYLVRHNVLFNFFAFSPYFLLILETDINKNEILCIHAGIHNNSNNDYNLDKIIEKQEQINSIGLYKIKEKEFNIDEIYKQGVIGSNSEDSPLRDRYYAVNNDGKLCEKNKNFKYSLTVVGHSPSQANYTGLENVNLTGEEYSKCDTQNEYKGRGCIIFKCSEHTNEMPRIVLVDTAMSESFTNASKRIPSNEQTRGIEFLHLTHTNNDSTRYFNNIYKYFINNSDNNSEDIRVYPKISSAEQKYLKYKAKYIKLKNLIK